MIDSVTRILSSRLPRLMLILWSCAVCADQASLVTFGPRAPASKGDQDFRQVVLIRVPATAPQTLYLRIFDPDVGGSLDEPNGPWNTHTRFALYGDRSGSRRDGRHPAG